MRKKHVLVVDDNAMNRRLACAFLSLLNWDVSECDSGIKALDVIFTQAVDAVLLDISMPDMNGEDVCRRIRQNPSFAELFIVAYTAHAMVEEKSRILSAGFNDILIKPVSFDMIKAIFDEQ